MRLIRINPTLKKQLEEVGPAIIEASAPITDVQLMKRLVALWSALNLPLRTPAEWEATTDTYVDALGNVPAEAIDVAIQRWNRCEMYPDEKGRHAFFPRPAELYALAEPKRLELGKAAYRARMALQKVEADTHRQPMTAEAAAERRQAAIDAGVLNPDGTVNMNPLKRVPTNTGPGPGTKGEEMV